MTSSITVSNGKGGFICFWTIQDFLNLSPDSNLRLRSQTFKTEMFGNNEWYLEILQEEENFLALYLCRQDGQLYLNVTYSYFLQTNFGWIPKITNVKHRFKNNGIGHGTAYFIEWKELQSKKVLYLLNGALTIGVHMYKQSVSSLSAQCSLLSKLGKNNNLSHLSHLKYCINIPENVSIFPFSNPTQIVIKNSDALLMKSECTQTEKLEDINIFEDVEDLLRLFKEKQFQYVILRSEKKEFAAHKALLCARSPVFNAMFENDMKENGSNIVDIDDIEGRTLSQLLHFIHLEPLPDLKWDEGVKLYYAADKYQVEILKAKCSSILKANLSTDNVCEALLLSDMYQDKDLRQNALNCFIKNSKFVLRSTKWKEFMKSNIDFASEILSELAETM